MGSIRIGLIGTGGMGTVHFNNYRYIEGAEVVAVVSASDKGKAKAENWRVPVFSTIEEMLNSMEVDMVDICTPTYMHKDNVLNVLDKGISVICEKPIALSVKDACSIFEKAKEKNVHVYVAQVLRFYKEYQMLKEMVDNETYGKLLDICFWRLSACPSWNQGGWLFDKTKSGVVPYDLHIHDLDFIVSLLGKPDSFIFTSCSGNKSYGEHYRFSYFFDKGKHNDENLNVTAEAAWFNTEYPWNSGYRAYFEKAVVELQHGKLMAYIKDEGAMEINIAEKVRIPTGINIPDTGVFLEELSHFLDCYRNNQPSSIVKEDEIIAVMEILEEINGAHE